MTFTHFSIEDENGISRVDKYQYKTLEKVTTVVDGKQIGRLGKFESYVFNNDETKLILGIDLQKVYRRSKKVPIMPTTSPQKEFL